MNSERLREWLWHNEPTLRDIMRDVLERPFEEWTTDSRVACFVDLCLARFIRGRLRTERSEYAAHVAASKAFDIPLGTLRSRIYRNRRKELSQSETKAA